MIGTVGGGIEGLNEFEANINSSRDNMNQCLNQIGTDIVNRLTQCYGGNAAETTIVSLQSASKNAETAITEIMTDMQQLISNTKDELQSVIDANVKDQF